MTLHDHAPFVAQPKPLEAAANLEQSRVRCYAILALADIAAITVSFLLANRLYLDDWEASHGIAIITVLVPIYLGIAIHGAYNGAVLREPRIGAFQTVRALALAAGSVLIIAYSFKVGGVFSRVVFWLGALLATGLLISGRLILGRLLLRALDGDPFRTVVIVDQVPPPTSISKQVIDAAAIGFDPRTDDPLQFHHIAKQVGAADRVVIACGDDRIAAWAHVLKCMAVDGEILAPEVDRIGTIGIGHYGEHQTLVVSAGPLHLRDRTIKRAFDITASLLALLILSPILVAVAIAIRLESPGPALFRQQRIGRDNTLFMMLKFRSMYQDRCDASASVLTGRTDNRVTRIGRFIRRNSIDELPQLLNVLGGSMSMVGPRPHALSAKAAEQLYWEIDARYRHRHAVKPGVTGLAQIRGYRGATVSASDLTNRLASDLEYLRDWSMAKDLWILFRTVFVIRHDNAF